MIAFIAQYKIEISYIICAMLGGVMHWLKKYLNNETDVLLNQWYGRDNVAATIYTITVFIFAIVGTLAADIITTATGFWAAMYTGFVTGFAIDSGFNRDVSQLNRDMIKNKNELNQYLTPKSAQVTRIPHYGSIDYDDEVDVSVDTDEELLDRRAALRKRLQGS